MILVAANCETFVLGDVLWVQTAQRDHFEFMAICGGLTRTARGFTRFDLGDKIIDDVKQKVTPGTSALFLLTDDTVVERVENALKDMNPHLMASNLSAEQEAKLREAFAEE